MPITRVDSERLTIFINLVRNSYTQKQSSWLYHDELFRLIDFNVKNINDDFNTKALAWLLASGVAPFESDPDDPIPNFNPDPPPQESTQVNHSDPLSIWVAIRDGNLTTSAIAQYILGTSWDFIDRRNVRKPLEKPAREVKELLQEQVVVGQNIGDLTPALRGLLEMIVKAFLHWHEGQAQNSDPAPHRYEV